MIPLRCDSFLADSSLDQTNTRPKPRVKFQEFLSAWLVPVGSSIEDHGITYIIKFYQCSRRQSVSHNLLEFPSFRKGKPSGVAVDESVTK
jgi:hypothetical protein